MHPTSTPWVINFIIRISLGACMIMVGIAMYREFQPFEASVVDGMGFLRIHGTIWAYAMPALLIVGGGLLMYGKGMFITAWVGGIALCSVPVGLLLKTILSGHPLPDILTALYPYFLWIILFWIGVNIPYVEKGEKGDEE
ncbi:MAG: hypothetical protein KBD00_05055 [Candidatus Peribacteraceae bacterium]|nr:hypothetical protein [Candidatus Peribacteraceae bacterium]